MYVVLHSLLCALSLFLSLYVCFCHTHSFLSIMTMSHSLIIIIPGTVYHIVRMESFTVCLSLCLSVSFSSDLPEHKEDPNDLSCDERAAQFQMLSTADCSTAVLDSHGTTMKSRTDMLQWRYKCCGTGQGACESDPIDYSAAVCKDPSNCALCCCRCLLVRFFFVLSLFFSLSLSLSSVDTVPRLTLESFLSLSLFFFRPSGA